MEKMSLSFRDKAKTFRYVLALIFCCDIGDFFMSSQYDLPKNGYVDLKIIDLLGRHVRELVSEERSAGHHQVTWKGLDDGGNRVASGVYLYRMTAEDYTETRKLLLLR